MTNEPPERAGRPRSDAASRLAALLSEIEASSPDSPAAQAVPAVESADGAASHDSPASSPATSPSVPAAVTPPSTPAAVTPTADQPAVGGDRAGASEPPELFAEPGAATGASATGAGGGTARRIAAVPDVVQAAAAGDSPAWAGAMLPPATGPIVGDSRVPRPRPSRLRSVSFGVTVTLLIVAIPLLGYMGSRAVLHSRGGKIESEQNDPRAAGYLAPVEPTPTALVVQRDANGAPVALTLLALGNGDSGGSVLFIPLDTDLTHPALYIDRLRTAYNRAGDATFLNQVGLLLNLGFDHIINLTDDDWAQMVAPVAPLTIQNPDTVVGEGITFDAGPLQLQANQVGAYLSAVTSGQDDLDRLSRHQLVWQAWLHAIATSATHPAVPDTTNGLGDFVTTLARGKASIATLGVIPAPVLAADGSETFEIDPATVQTQLTDAVPAPESPGLGDRFSVTILNGVDGSALPSDIAQRIVYDGGLVDSLGNADRFGVATTTIEYHDPNRRNTAISLRFVLGGGKVVYNPSSTDTVDITITIGRDLLSKFQSSSASGGHTGG